MTFVVQADALNLKSSASTAKATRCFVAINRSVAFSCVDVWNNSDFEALDGIIHPDYRARCGDRLMASGAAALGAWLSGLHEVFLEMR